MKILYIVLSAPYDPWKRLYTNGIAKTWVANERKRKRNMVFVSIGRRLPIGLSFFVNRFLQSTFGLPFWTSPVTRNHKVKIHGDTLFTSRIDRWDTMLGKLLDCARFCLETLEFDYLVRVNTTTHVNSQILENILSLNHIEYGGCRIKNEDCAAGWAMVLSRKSVEDLINFDFTQIQLTGKYEDGVVCQVMKKLNVGFTPLPYETWPDVNKEMSEKSLRDVPFIRVKSVHDEERDDDFYHQQLWSKLVILESDQSGL